MVTLTELESSTVEKGEHFRRTTISEELHQSVIYGRVARRKALLIKRHKEACLEFTKRHLKTLRPKDSQIELFGLNAKRHVWRKPGTIPTV